MASVVIEKPSVARILDITADEQTLLAMQLTYTDEKVAFELRKHKKGSWYINKYGYEAWETRYKELQAAVKKSLLFQDDRGFWTYSGLASKVAGILRCSLMNRVQYPDFGVLGWQEKPEYPPYPFQDQSQELLLAGKHAGVEIGTGLGKSYIILLLLKELGLKTVVMAPSKDIAKRLYSDCVKAFGAKKVGFFGDGTKKIGKLITVAIGASLTRVEPGSAEWDDLSKAKVFIADESHQCPASTLAKVCFGLLADAPYRFFLSATQMRNDGLDMLLDGITGPIVYRKTVREGIDEGYLAKLQFSMVKTSSPSDWSSPDPNEETRQHLFYNEKVVRQAADMANKFVGLADKQVLILVDEFEQFTRLYPLLKFQAKFAHGGVSKDNKGKLPEMFWESDPTEFVLEFNRGEFPILVGTSCITTGTDIKANEVTIYLKGGKSEVEVMQGACGRSTRLFTFEADRKWPTTGLPRKKTECRIVDFDVENCETTHRHAQERKSIYDFTYGPVQEVTYGN